MKFGIMTLIRRGKLLGLNPSHRGRVQMACMLKAFDMKLLYLAWKPIMEWVNWTDPLPRDTSV